MRAGWETLHATFQRSVTTLEADKKFKEAARAHPELATFAGPDGLVAHLTEKKGDLDEKDAIYAALVTAAQSRADWADLAQALLWLGLWPGLDAVYRRQLGRFRSRPEELVAELSFIFTTTIARIDLSGVRRPASTLILNVDRDITATCRRRWKENARREPLVEDDVALADGKSRSGVHAIDESSTLRKRLVEIVGEDANFVVALATEELNQRELAGKVGLSDAAFRKRIQRALKRLREKLNPEEWTCPISSPRTAFSFRADSTSRLNDEET